MYLAETKFQVYIFVKILCTLITQVLLNRFCSISTFWKGLDLQMIFKGVLGWDCGLRQIEDKVPKFQIYSMI
jgi:hypothetical protein